MSLLWTLLVIFHWLFYAFSDDLWIRVRLVSVWSSHRSLRTLIHFCGFSWNAFVSNIKLLVSNIRKPTHQNG